MKKLLVACAISLVLASQSAYAQSIEQQPDGTTSWQAGVDGATIEFGSDGSVKRIFSKYSHPVGIADKRGVHTAMVIAEEKAKGNIARFLEQHVASGKVVSELTNTLNKTTQEKTNDSKQLSTIDQRTMVESVAEMSSSFSAATLRGLVVLENGFDEKAGEAWVAVGLSQKSMGAAKAVGEMLIKSQPNPAPAASPNVGNPAAGAVPSSDMPRSVIRRGNQDF